MGEEKSIGIGSTGNKTMDNQGQTLATIWPEVFAASGRRLPHSNLWT
jgi:hypothetical protein